MLLCGLGLGLGLLLVCRCINDGCELGPEVWEKGGYHVSFECALCEMEVSKRGEVDEWMNGLSEVCLCNTVWERVLEDNGSLGAFHNRLGG